jgi:hypothetical protein
MDAILPMLLIEDTLIQEVRFQLIMEREFQTAQEVIILINFSVPNVQKA